MQWHQKHGFIYCTIIISTTLRIRIEWQDIHLLTILMPSQLMRHQKQCQLQLSWYILSKKKGWSMAYKHFQTAILQKYIQAFIATRCSQGQLVHVSLAGVLITETFPMPCVPNHAEGVGSTSSSMNTNTILLQQSSVQPFTLSISLIHFQSHKEILQTSDSRFPFRFNRLRTKNMFGEKIHLVHSSAPETPFKKSLLMPKRRISAVNKT